MSDPSRRQLAIADMLNRLSYIRRTNGYNSDAGEHVFLGEAPAFGPDDPPEAISVVIGPDRPTQRGMLVQLEAPFGIQACVPVDLPDAWEVIEGLIADIKRAVEIEREPSGERMLEGSMPGGLERGVTTPIARAEGSTYVGAEVEYLVTFEEPWGNP